ncbi:MAG TPA: hydroxyacid dehydrogenase [Acidimicrobiia bacterium]|nr:hydroxyacid dehydrogenase [Acidimicrobiia bacterium]
MTKVVVSEFLPEPHLGRLRQSFEVVYDPDLYADRDRLLAELAGTVAILIRNRTRIDPGLLAAAPNLRVVGRLGVGMDNIDTDACLLAGVTVIPAVGANAVSVAEYVIGAMLLLVRRVFDMTPSMVAGKWPRQGHAFGHELLGKTLGLIGLGSIARQVAVRAAAFGMGIVAFDPFLPEDDPAWATVGKVDLETLLATSDVVSLHVPLGDQTRNLVDAAAIAAMKPTAVLVNTSRGGIVDEPALARALESGALAGAALDVFSTEPLGPGPAGIFAGVPNLVLTPHLAGNTEEAVERVASMIVAAVIEALER